MNEAARLDPNRQEYAEGLAFTMTRVGRLADAIYYAKLAMALEPHPYIIDLLPRGMSSFRAALETATFSNHDFRAVKAFAEGNLEEAIKEARLELAVDSGSLSSGLVLIRALMDLRRFGEALGYIHSILATYPSNVEAKVLLPRCLQGLGRADEAAAAINEVMRIEGAGDELAMELTGIAAAQPDLAGLTVESRLAKRIGRPKLKYVSRGSVTGELVIGVLANTVTAGPLMSILVPFLRAKHPGHIVIFYGQGRSEDVQTQWLRHEAYRWHETFDLDDVTAGRIMSNDAIDVLLDMTATTRTARLPLIAGRPAPATVRWLGMPNADGALCNEYLISGPMTREVDAAAHDKCIVLNRTLAPFELLTSQTIGADLTQLPAKVNGVVTFGGIFDMARITPETAALWARVLRAVPNSQLLLGYYPISDPQVRDACLMRFANYGVADRILLQEVHAGVEDKVAFFALVDVCLDSIPVSMMVEAAESVAFGVPVVTLAGNRRLGRMGASMLHAANLQKLIAKDEADYVRIACGLVEDLDRLADDRITMPAQVLRSPLCDGPGFVEELTGLLRKLVGR
jgi:hypothetical protein